MRIKACGGRDGGGEVGETRVKAVEALIASSRLCVWFPVLSQCLTLSLNVVTSTLSFSHFRYFFFFLSPYKNNQLLNVKQVLFIIF